MARFSVPIDPHLNGFLVRVVLDHTSAAKSRLDALGREVPSPVIVTALVDTGATKCVAAPDLIDRLKLPSMSDRLRVFTTAAGSLRSREYYGALRLESAPAIQVGLFTMSRGGITGAPFDFVLGMNVLSRWDFSYRHSEGTLTLEGGE